MGMDVYGKKPDSPVGEYFRRNVWGWRRLADYCLEVAPEISGKCQYWHSNDGGGLNGRDSKKLANILDCEVESGDAAAKIGAGQAILDAAPDEPCRVCGGTGKRAEPPNIGPGDMPCNGCNGTGRVRPFATNYFLDVSDLKEFSEFLKHCGGFEIC